MLSKIARCKETYLECVLFRMKTTIGKMTCEMPKNHFGKECFFKGDFLNILESCDPSRTTASDGKIEDVFQPK